jgi:hypothetical protein
MRAQVDDMGKATNVVVLLVKINTNFFQEIAEMEEK